MSSGHKGLAKSLGFEDRHSIREPHKGLASGCMSDMMTWLCLSFRIWGGQGLTGKIPGHDDAITGPWWCSMPQDAVMMFAFYWGLIFAWPTGARQLCSVCFYASGLRSCLWSPSWSWTFVPPGWPPSFSLHLMLSSVVCVAVSPAVWGFRLCLCCRWFTRTYSEAGR